MEFNIGDVVKLKSGGPDMTVQSIVGVTTSKMETFAYNNSGFTEGDIICKWFQGTKLESAIFKQQTLEKIEELNTVTPNSNL